MKSHTKPALRALPTAQVQISLPLQGVLCDVRHAFLGLCIDAGQKGLIEAQSGWGNLRWPYASFHRGALQP